MNRRVNKGFTLVELLVVITIIAVLLALLSPALDQAVYQAELAVCGSKVNAIAKGVTTYAVDYKKWYPARAAVAGSWPADRIATHGKGNDSRVPLKGYVSLNGHLNCPFVKWLDIENLGHPPIANGTWAVHSTYALWWGWQYFNSPAGSERGSFKLYDRFTWNGGSWDLLASDHATTYPPGNWGYSTHQDKAGLGFQRYYADQEASSGPTQWYAWSFWMNPSNRGPLDLHFARQDGSVTRITDVLWDEAGDTADERMTKVPARTDATYTTAAEHYVQVPEN